MTAAEKNEVGFLAQYAGQGLEDFESKDIAMGYLHIVQPDSPQEAAGHKAGTWRCSTTDSNYGETVDVVVLARKNLWIEKDKGTGKTAGRYLPNSIKIDTRPNPKNKSYPIKINPETGNEINEIGVYVVFVKGHYDDGIMLYTPTLSSLGSCRVWNSAIVSKMQSGTKLPIFGTYWTLKSALIPNPVNSAKQMAKLDKATYAGTIEEENFTNYIAPQMQTARLALSAPSGLDQVDSEPVDIY